MHKLLVTSHKGGVGKTTTAVNLACVAGRAGQRVLVVDADPLGSVVYSLNLQLPAEARQNAGPRKTWAFWGGVLPGCDVLAPFEPGEVPEEKLTSLLRQMSAAWFQEKWGKYDLIVFDAPPFLGERTRQLLAACDDWLLVLRAEPLGFRTLPALLQLVRQAQATTTAGQLRGILLTMPPDGKVGSGCEPDLRRALGGRALPATIPYDPEVGRALLLHQPVTQLNPRSPASQEYRRLATDLGLVQPATAKAVPVAR